MQQATRHREDSHADSYTTRRDVTGAEDIRAMRHSIDERLPVAASAIPGD